MIMSYVAYERTYNTVMYVYGRHLNGGRSNDVQEGRGKSD